MVQARTALRHTKRALVLLIALACADSATGPDARGPKSPTGESPLRINCTASTRSKTVTCAAADSNAVLSAISRNSSGNALAADLILGGQHTFVELTGSNVVYSGQVFSFDATLQNLIPQKLGTTDGTTLDPTGIRVFFDTDPVATGGTGTIDFLDPADGVTSMVDGTTTFTQSNQEYYQYNQVLSPNQTSSAKQWRIHVPNTVTSFTFTVYVNAPVQFPNGWIDLSPTTALLKAGQTQQLTPTVRDYVGRDIGGAVSYGSNATGVATVNGSGLVTAVADGSATITATQGPRTGTSAITVSTAAGAQTVISGAPNPQTAGTAMTITVQAKNAANQNMTVGGDAVVLNTTAGTLGSVTDNGNGTYTTTLSSNTAQSGISVTGTINSVTIGNPATVAFTAGAPANVIISAGDGQTANSGATVATTPQVTVRDQFNNPVGAGIQVDFTISGGNGSVSGGSTTTNASGQASPTSWTLGNGGATCNAGNITGCSRNALLATVTGGSNPTVSFKGYIPPTVPSTATYQAVGNTTLSIATGIGLLQNAFSINGNGANGTGATMAVTTLTPSGSQSGTLTILADGSFSYVSSPTYVSAGAATEDFTYTVSDGIASTTVNATAQFNVPQHVWYVRPGYGGTSTGSDAQPYKDFSSTAGTGVESAAIAGETIYVQTGSGTATGGTLLNTQTVYGQGASVAATFTTGSAVTYRNGATVLTLLATGSAPSVGALTLGSGNTLRGLTLAGTLSGTSFGTLTASETAINVSGGAAINLATGTLSGSFTSVTSTGGTNNILLTTVGTSGTFALGSGALSGASGDGFKISGGAGTFTYSGTITNAATLAVNIASMTGGGATLSGSINSGGANKGISIGSNSGGAAITLSGTPKLISTGTGAGVSLTSNTGATITISGGGMAITTTSGGGIVATGGGTINITGGTNTISSGTGTALTVTSTTIGASGLTFQSISANGGSNGISLTTTGATGGLTVTGDGGSSNNSSGGTIQNTTNAGIALSNVTGVSLDQMNIQSTGGSGVNGALVTNFSITNSTINNSGDTGRESNIAFNNSGATTGNNISGTFVATGNTLTNAFYSGIDLTGDNGTISNATISNNTITSTTSTATSKGDGIGISGGGNGGTLSTVFSVTNATISGNTITNFPSGSGIIVNLGNITTNGPGAIAGIPNNGSAVITISGNSVSGASSSNRIGQWGIFAGIIGVTSGSGGQANFNITNNNPIQHVTNDGIAVANQFFATATVSVTNNTVTGNQVAASGKSGILLVNAGGLAAHNPTTTATITGNTTSATDAWGILAYSRGGIGVLDIKVATNNVSAPVSSGFEGIRVDAGDATSTNVAVCLNINSNTTAGSGGAAGIGIRKEGSVAGTHIFGLPGLTPSPTTGANAVALVVANNPSSTGGATNIAGNDNYVTCSSAPS